MSLEMRCSADFSAAGSGMPTTAHALKEPNVVQSYLLLVGLPDNVQVMINGLSFPNIGCKCLRGRRTRLTLPLHHQQPLLKSLVRARHSEYIKSPEALKAEIHGLIGEHAITEVRKEGEMKKLNIFRMAYAQLKLFLRAGKLYHVNWNLLYLL